MNPKLIVKSVESPDEWEAVKSLRIQVFVQEQGVPLDEELDGHDEFAVHAVALIEGRIVGTGRMFSIHFGEGHIGRMAVYSEHRRLGIGFGLLIFLENRAREQGIKTVKLHAQVYVKSFYERHGYIAQGSPFTEVDIEHIVMIKELNTNPKEG